MAGSDHWPSYNIGTGDHLHAIGVLISAWNEVEVCFQAFIQQIFPNHLKAGIRTFELLGYDQRLKLIRSDLFPQLTDEETDRVEHFFKCSNICKENRNIIAHAQHHATSEEGKLRLTTQSANSSAQFLVSLDGLREMADSAQETFTFGLSVWSVIQLRLSNDAWVKQGVPPRFFQPLPQKPALPRSWDQIREAPKPRPIPPGSSQA